MIRSNALRIASTASRRALLHTPAVPYGVAHCATGSCSHPATLGKQPPLALARTMLTSTTVAPADPYRRHMSSGPGIPDVFTFFDVPTATWTYVVADPATRDAVVIDPVLDYEPNSGTVSTRTADGILAFIDSNALCVRRILETHAHADHLTAAQYYKEQLGGDVPVCIGTRIGQVQSTFGAIYGIPQEELKGAFDELFEDEQEFNVGDLTCRVIHLPGHTPDHVGYVLGNSVFTGDSIFLPDVGSARADFPGGSAADLYTSMQRLLALPPSTRLFVGHDYPADDRSQSCWSTVADQRQRNKHGKHGVDAAAFVKFRSERDAGLGAPKLLHPALQVNIRAGRLPKPDEDGRVFFNIPVRS